MIQVSLYYLISSIVVLPGVTFYFTNKYYTNKIDQILKDCENNLQTLDIVDTDEPMIISPTSLTHQQKIEMLNSHFTKLNENILYD